MIFKNGFASQVKDFSFANIFWKKFAFRVVAFTIVSILLFTISQNLFVKLCDEWVNHQLTNVAFQIAQTEDREMPSREKSGNENIYLAKTYDVLISNDFILDSSLIMYNMNTRNVVAQSFYTPIVESEKLIDWWRKEAESEYGLPSIHLDDEMVDFYYKNENKTVAIKQIYCLNSILFPTAIVAMNGNGDEIDSYQISTPTLVSQYTDVEPVELKIIGNQSDDPVYKLLSDHQFQIEDPTHQDKIEIVYNETIDGSRVKLLSKTFTINDVDYRIDCAYQSNFWFGAWEYVAMFELFGLLLCAAIAFFNTKETLSAMYH